MAIQDLLVATDFTLPASDSDNSNMDPNQPPQADETAVEPMVQAPQVDSIESDPMPVESESALDVDASEAMAESNRTESQMSG